MTPLTISDAAEALRRGERTSVGLLQNANDQADKLDPQLGIYLARFAEEATAAAEQADRELASGTDRGPLHGIPIAIKDILATRERPATGQSLVNDPTWWQGEDAPVVERLRAAGAVITGKTTTMEYAIGMPDPSKPFPVPRNPWNPATWPGGSSSGSGAGVAAGAFLGALGTDTGGSVRIPAAYCGITGLKPTYGLVPRAGCLPLGFSLDHIGPMARSAMDCAILLNAMAGYDARDPAAQQASPADFTTALTGDLTGLRIGVERKIPSSAPEPDDALSPLFEAAVAELGQAGATIIEVEVPAYQALADADLVIMVAEAFSYHRASLADRWDDYGCYTRTFIAQGALLSGGDYVTAQRARRVACAALDDVLTSVDVIVTPTAATGAPSYDGIEISRVMASLFTGAFNTTGLPVVAAPIGRTAAELPLSMQVIGRPLADATVLAVADALQRRTSHHLAIAEVAARV